jgi:hypothetical protein
MEQVAVNILGTMDQVPHDHPVGRRLHLGGIVYGLRGGIRMGGGAHTAYPLGYERRINGQLPDKKGFKTPVHIARQFGVGYDSAVYHQFYLEMPFYSRYRINNGCGHNYAPLRLMIEQVKPFVYPLREGNIIYFPVERHIGKRWLGASDADMVYPGGGTPCNFPVVVKICVIPAYYRAGTVGILSAASYLPHAFYRISHMVSKIPLVMLQFPLAVLMNRLTEDGFSH